jgi:hypothetical protein
LRAYAVRYLHPNLAAAQIARGKRTNRCKITCFESPVLHSVRSLTSSNGNSSLIRLMESAKIMSLIA